MNFIDVPKAKRLKVILFMYTANGDQTVVKQLFILIVECLAQLSCGAMHGFRNKPFWSLCCGCVHAPAWH